MSLLHVVIWKLFYFLMQNLTSRIAYKKPDDPLHFVLDEIEKMRRGEKVEELK